MVVIRLARSGAKRKPFYRVVIATKTAPRDGRCIERVGFFNPVARGQETKLQLNRERIQHWLDQGAQPSARVLALVKEWDKSAVA